MISPMGQSQPLMKKILLPAVFSLSLATTSPARTCREVVRDSSGRIFQTIERQKQAGGTADSSKVAGTTTRTQYRDASGRLPGSSTGSGKYPAWSAYQCSQRT